MAKKSTHLALVGTRASSGAAAKFGQDSSLALEALGELPQKEKVRVGRIVDGIASKAAVIGVQRGERDWDLRPIVAVGSEPCPSIIRFFGPEVSLSSSITTRTRELLDRIASVESIQAASLLIEWGELEGQLWYRRYVSQMTLAEALEQWKPFPLTEAIKISKNLIKCLEEYHARGIVHGHLCPANIAFTAELEVSLLDAGAGLAVLQASAQLGLEPSSQNAAPKSFAPEAAQGESAIFSTDIFGLGSILSSMFRKVSKSSNTGFQPGSALHSLINECTAMCNANPSKRPSFSHIKELLGEKGLAYTEEKLEPFRVQPSNRARRVTVTVRQPSSAQPVSGQAAVVDSPPAPTLQPESQTEPVAYSEPEPLKEPKPVEPPPVSPLPSEPVTADPSIWEQNVAHDEELALDSQKSAGILKWMTLVVLFLFAAAAGAYYFRFLHNPQYQYSEIELTQLWNGGRPSARAKVALAAINPDDPSTFAENLIISSALNDDGKLSEPSADLIRIAMDEQWEPELLDYDIRVALTLALSEMLGDRMPSEPLEIDKVHPGVMLAITAVSGDNAQSFLKGVSAHGLTELPDPYGQAFIELARLEEKLDCGSPAVRALARLAIYGIDERQSLASLIGTSPNSGLRVLAVLYARNDIQARKLLDVIVKNRDARIKSKQLDWAEKWSLLKWGELSSSDQLLVLAGIYPSKKVHSQNIAKLFAHPVAKMRAAAISRAVERLEFAHPAAKHVLLSIAQNPELLTAQQTVELAAILERPSGVASADVRAWLESNPPKELAVALLLSSAAESSSLDFELLRHLKNMHWEPSFAGLNQLAYHPNEMARLFAYGKVFDLKDRNIARSILLKARKKEPNPEIKEHLAVMIQQLIESSP